MKKFLPFLALAATLSLPAAEWFVNNRTGDDANDGSSAAKARKSFAAVMKLVKPGDTLQIADTGSPYYESLALRGDFGKNGAPLTVEGNGAVISGLTELDPAQWVPRDGGFFYPIGKRPSNWRLYLYENGRRLPLDSFAWKGDGFLFRPAEGKTPADYRLSANLRDSGVQIGHGKNITIRNLVAEHHGNDGFNIHGSCYGLRFEGVTGRHNGDDGFSAHEDGEAYVINSEFHGNSYGIEDINLSRTTFVNVRIHGNQTGVHFSGGYHALIDCTLSDNLVQLRVDAGRPAVYLPDAPEAAGFDGECFIKNTRVTGGNEGLRVSRRSKVTLLNSLFRTGGAAVELTPGSELYLAGTVLTGDLPIAVNQARLFGDKNLFFPDRMKFDQKGVALAEFKELTKSNAQSIAEEPRLKGDRVEQQPFLGKSPRLHLGPGF